MTNIAIIGAGLSGLTLAHKLKDVADIHIYEKSRGVGGRLATRRAEPFHFDHGAQFFLAKTEAFSEFLEPLFKEGVVEPWCARFQEMQGNKVVAQRLWTKEQGHFVSVPSMNGVAKFLSQGLEVRLNREIRGFQKRDGWVLVDTNNNEHGPYDWVVTTAPSAQSSKLLPLEFKYHQDISDIKMLGCYALMLGFDAPLSLNFDAAYVSQADISWISVNSSKPGRPDNYCLQVHATNKWAEEHMEDEQGFVMAHLIEETSRVVGLDLSKADHKGLHRWRYANIERQAGGDYFLDIENRLAACGDWCVEGRVEAAFTSAHALAKAFHKHKSL
ncbi:MAG: FAD-dependent oxidoreductase [Hyphomicrobiales bacterium]